MKADWMFGDASVSGIGSIGHHFARLNPLRWSSRKSLLETIKELEDYRGKELHRPIRMRVFSDSSTSEENTTIDEAIVRLRTHSGSWHMTSLLRRSTTTNEVLRKVCDHGTRCYRINPQHLAECAHPADQDYLDCCRQEGVDPEFVSMRMLFNFLDSGRLGKVTHEDLTKNWSKVQELSDNVADFDEAMWKKLDDDGNGFVNFAEFVEFLAACKVDLPLGLDDLLGRETGSLRCGVLDCSCKEFVQRRKRCKYGAACYQRKEEHLRQFSHPNDNDWGETSIYRDADMCACGHKRQLHASACSGAGSVDYPTYWASQCGRDAECLELVPVDAEMVRQFQALLDATYSDVTTRDRANHSGGCWMVPRNYSLVSALRNENSRLWRKYTIRKAELQREKKLTDENPQLAAELPPYFVYSDVKTTKVWESFGGVDTLDRNINEWYLFHGTSPKAAEMICRTDFKYTLAGSATGTLYGRGSYLAEAITKADEYSSADESTDGCFTVLLCRVLGGRVRYCDQRVPHPDQLTADCVEGPYDCILGDREKLSGTYREFITFDTENLYPEYILRYTRGELFKSPSYPANQP
eukprot:CAMPEP_0117514204 /NCGR_PEP_ID=MMETSP0784-20121206/29949_1 /TAXON_ID=39447 /ORGANISM="" /LENGTH=580 /DNA_ID=CAMNT_0005309993 /DNA_START=105 /DNA_END=1847 /DNA_ORIENTATION=-